MSIQSRIVTSKQQKHAARLGISSIDLGHILGTAHSVEVADFVLEHAQAAMFDGYQQFWHIVAHGKSERLDIIGAVLENGLTFREAELPFTDYALTFHSVEQVNTLAEAAKNLVEAKRKVTELENKYKAENQEKSPAAAATVQEIRQTNGTAIRR